MNVICPVIVIKYVISADFRRNFSDASMERRLLWRSEAWQKRLTVSRTSEPSKVPTG